MNSIEDNLAVGNGRLGFWLTGCRKIVGIGLMPTVLRNGPYRLYFYSHDLIKEPSHVHVDRDELSAKFWPEPVALARNLGFNASELRRIERIVNEYQVQLVERWDKEYGRASG